MKRICRIFLSILPVLSLAACGQEPEKHSDLSDYYTYSESDGPTVHISGKSRDRQLPDILVQLYGNDHYRDPYYLIKVSDGRFEADLPLDPNQVYELIVPQPIPEDAVMPKSMRESWDDYNYGAMRLCTFFADTGHIRFIIDKEDQPSLHVFQKSRNNKSLRKYIKGNRAFRKAEMKALMARQDELDRNNDLMTETFLNLCSESSNEEYSQAKRDSLWHEAMILQQSGESRTPAGRKWEDDYCNELQRHLDFATDFISGQEPDLSNFLILTENLTKVIYYRNLNASKLIGLYQERYANLFPNCILHRTVQDVIADINVYEGVHYTDFTLPDRNGNTHTLSAQIDGKIAVVELWASWCRSCRIKHKALVPLYEKYKDSGFTVVGVAREYKETGQWIEAMDQDGYPWLNLVALETDHQIWSSYGMSNSAGGTFLIDENGIIVKINPSPDYIEKFILSHMEEQ